MVLRGMKLYRTDLVGSRRTRTTNHRLSAAIASKQRRLDQLSKQIESAQSDVRNAMRSFELDPSHHNRVRLADARTALEKKAIVFNEFNEKMVGLLRKK